MSLIKRSIYVKFGAVFVLFGLTVWGCGKTNEPVARVGNSSITTSQFEETFIKKRSIDAAQQATLAQKENVLNEMVNRRLQYLEAVAQGLDRRPDFLKKKKDFIKQTTFWAGIEANVIPRVIPEKEIKNIWRHSNINLKIRHILLKIAPNATKKQIDSTRVLAGEILKKLRSGNDFVQMAEKYSGDERTKRYGGNMGYVKWEQLDPKIRNIVFSLKRYQISEPLRTAEGFEIIQVLQRRIFPRKPYELARVQILNTLMRRNTRALNQAYIAYWGELQKKYKVVWFDKNIKLLADSLYFPRPRRTPKGFAPDTSSQFKKLSPKQMDLPLVKYSEKTYTINAFADLVSTGPSHRTRKPLRGEKAIRSILDNILQREIIAKEAQKRGLVNKERYQKQISDFLNRQLYQTIRSEEITKKVVVTDSMLKRFYKEHPGLYKEAPRVKVQVVMVKNKDLADKVYRLARKGQNFTRLAEKYNQMAGTKKSKGMLGYIGQNSYGLIGTEAFRGKVGEVRGPLNQGSNYYVLKILARKPERLKTFKEARFDVEKDLRGRLTRYREKEWLNQLHKKFPVVIFKKNLENTFQEYSTEGI